MDYRPVMGGEERREYIYNGLVAGALRDGNSHDEAIAYANEILTIMLLFLGVDMSIGMISCSKRKSPDL